MSVNVPNIIRLRDAILAAPENFDMHYWGRRGETLLSPSPEEVIEHTCGTIACIGGWTAALFFPEADRIVEITEYQVGEVLGLTPNQVSHLCYPTVKMNGRRPYDATNVEAARVLDHIIETGQVDWSKAFA